MICHPWYVMACKTPVNVTLFAESLLSVVGHVKAELLPNGEAVVVGQEAHGGRTPPLATPSPGSPLSAQLDPGVASFPDSLEKSEAALAEGSIHKGDALQSLRLSIPMQETELCKHTILDNPQNHPRPFLLCCNSRPVWLLRLI